MNIYNMLCDDKFRNDLSDYITKHVPELLECDPNNHYHDYIMFKKLNQGWKSKNVVFQLCICEKADKVGSYQGLFEYAENDTLDELEDTGNDHSEWGFSMRFGGWKYTDLGTRVKNTIITFVRQYKLERIIND